MRQCCEGRASGLDDRLVGASGLDGEELSELSPHRADLGAVAGKKRKPGHVLQPRHSREIARDHLSAESGPFENVEAAEGLRKAIHIGQVAAPGQAGHNLWRVARRA